ncbi:hypothetical protein NBRC10512v2_003076 [Rhodotorula toruloides]
MSSRSSSSSSESDEPVPAWSYDRLPLEIKQKIAHYCWRQDTWLDECFGTVLTYTQEGRWDSANLLQHMRDIGNTYRFSIGSLFRLSRSWSVAAAPYRFKVRCLSPDFQSRPDMYLNRLSRPPGLAAYRHRIAPRYGKFVETLHFDKIDGDSDLQAVLLLSPFFSRLNKIIVKRPGLSNVLATGLLQQDHLSECSFMTEPGGNDPLGLPSLFANVTSLDLEMDERMCFMRAIQATRGLHSLHLRGDLAEFNYSISMQTLLLPKLFADMTQLETLKWTGVRVSTFKAFCSSDDDWKGGLPRLRHITIGFDGLLQDTLEFVSMFADSLEHLVLEFTENSTARKEMPTWKLPRLKILEMKGQNGEALRTFACSIYEWTYPALERLHVCPIALFDDDEDLTVRFLEEQITDHDSRTPSNPLRFIQIWDASFPLNSSWQRHIRTVLARHNRQVSTTPMEPYPDSFFLHAELRRYDEKRGRSGQDKIAQLDRVFEFLGDWYTRAKTTRNDADLARQAVILERAELERVVRTGG